MTTYSTRLSAGVVGTAAAAAFTVPAGHRVVVRHVYVIQVGAGGTGVILYLYPGSIELFRAVPSPSTSAYHADVRLVFHEGETCQLRALGTTAVTSLNGYLLAGAGGPLSSGATTKPG